MIRAIEDYDPEQGVAFSTLLKVYVRQHLNRLYNEATRQKRFTGTTPDSLDRLSEINKEGGTETDSTFEVKCKDFIKSTVNQSSDLNVAQALSTGGSSGAITMDIAVKDEVESPHYEGVGVGMAFTKIITHDINSKATNSGNTTVASPVNTATVITIN